MYQNIEAEIARSRMKKSDVSKALGVTHKTLNNWIDEKTPITGEALLMMSKLFNCSVDYLLGLDNKTA